MVRHADNSGLRHHSPYMSAPHSFGSDTSLAYRLFRHRIRAISFCNFAARHRVAAFAFFHTPHSISGAHIKKTIRRFALGRKNSEGVCGTRQTTWARRETSPVMPLSQSALGDWDDVLHVLIHRVIGLCIFAFHNVLASESFRVICYPPWRHILCSFFHICYELGEQRRVP